MSIRTKNVTRQTATTANSTAITLASVTLPQDSSARIEANVSAREAATGDSLGVTLHGSASRDGGAAILVGSANLSDQRSAGLLLLGPAVSLDVSGNDVRVRVAGSAGKTIEWTADLIAWIN